MLEYKLETGLESQEAYKRFFQPQILFLLTEQRRHADFEKADTPNYLKENWIKSEVLRRILTELACVDCRTIHESCRSRLRKHNILYPKSEPQRHLNFAIWWFMRDFLSQFCYIMSRHG